MSIQHPHRSGQSGRESGIDLTIGDVYEGDSLGALTPSAVDVEMIQPQRGLPVMTEVGDEDNGAWVSILADDAVELEQ